MNLMQQQATEAAVTKVATLAQYVGSGGAVVFGLTTSEWSVLGIIIVAVLGFAVNWYYRAQHLRLAQEKRVQWDARGEQ